MESFLKVRTSDSEGPVIHGAEPGGGVGGVKSRCASEPCVDGVGVYGWRRLDRQGGTKPLTDL